MFDLKGAGLPSYPWSPPVLLPNILQYIHNTFWVSCIAFSELNFLDSTLDYSPTLLFPYPHQTSPTLNRVSVSSPTAFAYQGDPLRFPFVQVSFIILTSLLTSSLLCPNSHEYIYTVMHFRV